MISRDQGKGLSMDLGHKSVMEEIVPADEGSEDLGGQGAVCIVYTVSCVP